MKKLFRHLHMEPLLVIEFVATFSRLEYALKSTRFCSEVKTQADWDAFATEIDSSFTSLDCKELLDARDYLLTNPPRKQKKCNGELRFVEDSARDYCNTRQLIKYIKTVRNNLFHGGKYSPDGEKEARRNHQLVNSSLIILKNCYPILPDVKKSFDR